MNKHFKNILLLPFIASLIACASLDYVSPDTANLSGDWVIDPKLSQTVIFSSNRADNRGQSSKKGGSRAGGPPPDGGRGGQGRRGGNGEDSSNADYSRHPSKKPDAAIATEMTIEQGSDSMGVRYQSGNYRDVDWGVTEKRNQTITAGWQNESLVVKTKGRRNTVTETYQLNNKDKVLTVQFEVEGEQYTRIYRRASADASLVTP